MCVCVWGGGGGGGGASDTPKVYYLFNMMYFGIWEMEVIFFDTNTSKTRHRPVSCLWIENFRLMPAHTYGLMFFMIGITKCRL